MRHHVAVLTAVLLVAAGLQDAYADDPTTLRMKLEKGKSYVYADAVRADVTQEMGGQEMKINTHSLVVSRISVEGIRQDGSFSLITVVDSLLSSVKSPMQDTTRLMTEMMGKRSRVVLSPLGKVVERAVIDSVKGSRQMMRGSAVREVVRFHTLPEQPVIPGSQWTVSTLDSTDAMNGHMVTAYTITYTFAGNEEKGGRRCVKITYTGTMTIEGKGSMMGMEVFSEGKGTLSGTWHFDPQAGLTVAEEGLLDTDVTLAMTGQQNMTIPITSSTKVSRSLRSAEAITK